MASKIAGTAIKRATGLTGMAVARNAHHTLEVLYGKTLRALEKMPKEAAYRKYTHELVSEKNALVKSEPDVFALEKKIGCGQIEEVIIQAENELMLCRKMVEWKAWEPLQTQASPNQWKWPI